jgi:hypothetical protein
MITRGYLTGLVVTRGYGPAVTAPLSSIDTGHKSISTRGFESLTKTRTTKVLNKRTVSAK